MPPGGSIFFFPYIVWAIRLGYRLATGSAPTPKEVRTVGFKVVGSAAGIVVFFLAFPFWMTSTFGVATLGDPANIVTVINATGEPIFFYSDRRVPAYRERIEAGETKAWDWLEHGAYSPAAEDMTGARIFCRYLLDRELRRAHYQITVVRDATTCQTR